MASTTTTTASSTAMLAIALLLLSTFVHVRSDASDHRYKAGDFVPLYANKVGPFHNPSETYRYFDLPFCSPGFLQISQFFFLIIFLLLSRQHIIVLV
uniref:Transmembrane 9 superfamily member n=1 Tax=Kalanchoe fedtschenkoi TaxID=63787 RepID=A0A7N0U0H7_KALFE